MEGERVSASFQLSKILGRPPSEHLKTVGPLPMPVLPSEEKIVSLAKSVDQLPQVAMLRLQSLASLTHAKEEKARNGHSFRFGLQAQRESRGSKILMGTFGISLSGSDKGQEQRTSLKIEALRSVEKANEKANILRMELAEAIHELEHSQELWNIIQKDLIPASKNLLQKRELQLRLGEGTVLEVLRARTKLLAAKRFEAKAQVERRWAQVHLWILLAEIELSIARSPKG